MAVPAVMRPSAVVKIPKRNAIWWRIERFFAGPAASSSGGVVLNRDPRRIHWVLTAG